jgi:hypothetical protein
MAITIRKTPCPDVDLEINGVNEGSFAAGSTIELNLTDGVNPVTPDSVTVVGNVVTAQVPAASTGWTRNPDWLPLPEITASDNRFVGLFLVFEGEYNQTTVLLTSAAANVDWGDGTSVVSNGAVQTKVYDYATISSPVKQYYDGRNYKQVIVDVTATGVGTLSITIFDANSTVNSGGANNFVDIALSLPNSSNMRLSVFRRMAILERIRLLNIGTSPVPVLMNSVMLSVFEIGATTNTTAQSLFNSSGCVDLSGGLIANWSNIAQLLDTSDVRFFGASSFPNATSMAFFANGADNLISVSIDAPSNTSLSNAFNTALNLRSIILSGCGNVNNTGNAFLNCISLSKLILNGMRWGFSIAQCNLTAQALNDLFDSLGTASGSQTIIVTGNPGAATCDTTIATAKGFTVTT